MNLEKIDFIVLLLDYFKETPLVYKDNSIKTNDLIKEFEDLLGMAQEMI